MQQTSIEATPYIVDYGFLISIDLVEISPKKKHKVLKRMRVKLASFSSKSSRS